RSRLSVRRRWLLMSRLRRLEPFADEDLQEPRPLLYPVDRIDSIVPVRHLADQEHQAVVGLDDPRLVPDIIDDGRRCRVWRSTNGEARRHAAELGARADEFHPSRIGRVAGEPRVLDLARL